MKLRFDILLPTLFFIQLCSIVFALKNEIKQPLFFKQETFSTTVTSKKNSWMFICKNGFDLYDEKMQKIESLPAIITVTAKSSKLCINGIRRKENTIFIVPQKFEFSYMAEQFQGYLSINNVKSNVKITYFNTKNSAIPFSVVCNDRWQKELNLSMAASTSGSHIKENNVIKSPQFTVRVLLEELNETAVWRLQSAKGFIISDQKLTDKIYINEPILNIKMKNSGTITVNNKKISTHALYITPISGKTLFGAKEFPGSILIRSTAEKNYLINCVGIEDYVASVLCTESWPGWSLEMNKVLAIASRTYAIAMVQNAGIAQRLYHVKNTNIHQTYSGKTIAHHKLAAQETRGIFLSYNNQPITAMFDACCGGVVPAKMHGVNFDTAPYLARQKACEYCKNWKFFSWQVEYDIAKLEKILKQEISSIKKVKDVKISKKDPAGCVHQVQIKGSNLTHVTGKKIYSLLNKQVKSFCYTVCKNADKIIFKGKGYGHHLGLCQWGANAMVADGWDYKSILDFYYPGTKLMRLL